MQSRRDNVAARIDSKLRVRLRIFSVIALVMLAVILFDVFSGRLAGGLALVAVAAGVLIGVLVSRMFRLSWHAENGVVVSRIDWIGLGILLAYLVFSIFRNRLIGTWIQGVTEVAASGLAISAGVMVGRVLGMHLGIRRLLSIWVPEVLVRPGNGD